MSFIPTKFFMENKERIVRSIKDKDLDLFKTLLSEIAENSLELTTFSDLNNREFNHTSIDETIFDRIPITGLTLLHIASRYNSLECFKFIHEDKKIPLKILSENKLIPLQYACFYGSTDVALYILNEDPDECKYHDDEKSIFSVLYCATIGGKIEIMQELFNKGAQLTDPWNDQYMILNKAIALFNDIFEFLYPKRSPDFTTPPERPPLAICAIIDHNLKALEIVYNKETDLTYHYTGAKGYRSFIEHILTSRDLRFKDFLIKILTDAKDISFEPPETPGQLQEGVCHWVCSYCDVDVANLMFKTKDVNINRYDQHHKRGADYLIVNKDRKKATEMLQCLIENGFNINQRFDNNSPSLLQDFLCGISKNYEAIELLIKYGADVNAPIIKRNVIQFPSIIQYVMNQQDKRMKRIFNIQE